MATSVQLRTEIEQRLNNLAAQTGRSKAYYLRSIIENGLDDIEDYYLSAEIINRVRQGKEPVRTSAEVKSVLK